MSEWKKVKIGKFLTESKVLAEESDAAHRITVRLNCKGVEKRGLKAEKEGATKYYTRYAGQFIYGKQNIHKGAFGIIPPELDGFTSSADLPAFDIDKSKCIPEWIPLCLKVDERYKTLQKEVKGVGSQRLAVNVFLNVEIPLPDVSIQRKILAKVGKKIASIALLDDETEKQKSYAKQLRQNILQEAIEGKLTADWRKQHPVQKGNPDYDAEALFEQIQTEKQETKKSKKSIIPITNNEIPFEIPTNWKWVRLGEIAEILGGFAFKSYEFKDSGKNLVLRLGNIRTGFLRYEATPAFISNELATQVVDFKIKLNDILVTMTGTRGKRDYLYTLQILNEHIERYNMYLNQRLANIRSYCNSTYIYIVMQNELLKEPIFESATGSANQANIGMNALQNWCSPLPPLAEQKEIVTRVEAKLQTITQLETQIATRETTTKQLMQSILKDAFER